MQNEITPKTEKTIDEATQKLEEGKAGESVNLEQNVDPAAQAAHHMPGMLAYFKHLVLDVMGGIHAKRVLVALSEVPFNKEEPHFTTDAQTEAYQLGQQIFNGKFLLLMASLREASQKKSEEMSETKEKEEKND